MSTLFGIVTSSAIQVNLEELQRMDQTLHYWESDARQLYSDGSVGFGSLILHNTVQAVHEKQPYTSSNSECTIVADA